MREIALPDQFRDQLVSAARDFRSLGDDARRELIEGRTIASGTRRTLGHGASAVFRASTGDVLTGDDRTEMAVSPLLRELRDSLGKPDDEKRGVWGYGSAFDVGYMFVDRWGPYVERMNRYAFEESLALPDLQTSFLRSHGGLGLATTRGGRMALGTDDYGLGFVAYLDTAESDARDLVTKMENGSATTDTSVGGSIEASQWNSDYTELEIYSWSISRGEVSAVMAGANPAGWIDLIREDPTAVDQTALDEVMLERMALSKEE